MDPMADPMADPAQAGGTALATQPNPPPLDLSWLAPPKPKLAIGFDDDDYTPAPKFVAKDVKFVADQLQADHSVRIVQSKEYAHFLGCGNPGFFKEDVDLIKDDIMETMPLLGAREDFEFRCGFLSMHEPTVRLWGRDALEHDEAMVVEDLVIYDFGCEERQYSRTYGADLSYAEAAHAQIFGMLVGLDVLDPEDTECGLAMQLIDPLTFFPVWGGPAGLVEAYRVFEDTNAVIVGTYGGRPGSKEYERIKKAVEKGARKTKNGRKNLVDRAELRTITEAWNADRMTVIIDEDEILCERTHGYRELPFTVRVGAFDQPMGVTIGGDAEYGDPQTETTFWGDVTVSNRSMDLARQLRPYAWRQMHAHRIAEAVAGRRLSIFKWAIDPHKVLEYDPSMEWKMADEVDLLPGETTKIPLPSKLNLVTPVMDVNVMAGLAADLQSNTGSGFLTQMRMGTIPPQTSGSALSKMANLGGASEANLIRMVAGFKRDRAEFRLRLRRDFGDAIGNPLGTIRFPSQQPSGYGPLYEVTPEILQRAGCKLELELFHWEPDVALAQYLTTVRSPSPLTGKPLISDETARRKLRATPDVEREMERIDDEALASLPPVQQRRHIARLEKELDRALSEGDDVDAEAIMVAIEELEFLHETAIAQGAAAPAAAGPPGAGGGMPPPGGAPPDQGVPMAPVKPGNAGSPVLPGTSLPEQGIDVGTGGGRPPKPIAPVTPVGGA
jgi:hypothetical protein